MNTRNILDPHGMAIGTLTLPSSTTELEWAQALSLYAVPLSTRDIELAAAIDALKANALTKDYADLTEIEKKVLFSIPLSSEEEEEILGGSP